MYFLLVSEACPDIKRPYVDTQLFFFQTKEECYTQLKICKIDFICQNDISEDFRIENLNVNSYEGLIDELFLNTSKYDTYYNESYMVNPPFNSVIGIVSSGMKYCI